MITNWSSVRASTAAVLQAGDLVVKGIAQAAGHPFAGAQAALQRCPAARLLLVRLAARQRHGAIGIVGPLTECLDALVEGRGGPEARLRALAHGLEAPIRQSLGHDDEPGHDRHAEEKDKDEAGDEVALLPDVGDAVLFHFLLR
ncbi:hypothetical protein PPH41_13100 [Burkholderia gladioli]|nr:hypothetical protein [Burkholderia gladioli]